MLITWLIKAGHEVAQNQKSRHFKDWYLFFRKSVKVNLDEKANELTDDQLKRLKHYTLRSDTRFDILVAILEILIDLTNFENYIASARKIITGEITLKPYTIIFAYCLIHEVELMKRSSSNKCIFSNEPLLNVARHQDIIEELKPEAVDVRIPDILLRFLCGIIKHSEWVATEQGLITSAVNVKKLSPELFSAKRHNAFLSLNYLLKICGIDLTLPENNILQIKKSEDDFQLCVPSKIIAQPELRKLINEPELLKSCRKHLILLSNQTRALNSISELENLISESQKKIEDPQTNRPLQKQTQHERSQLEKEKKQKKKPPNTNKKIPKQIKTHTTTSTSEKPDQARNKKKKSGPKTPQKSKILRQSEERYKSVEKIKPALFGDIVTQPGTEDYQRVEEQLEQHQEEMRRVLSHDLLKQLPVFSRILKLLNHLDTVITTAEESDKTEENSMDHVAAWHYVYGQINNLLTFLGDEHPVRKMLFNALLDQGSRFYDRQKHCYFPKVVNTNHLSHQACFQNTLALLQTLSHIVDNNLEPNNHELKLAQQIITNWSQYLNSQYEEFNIEKLTESCKDASEFIAWVRMKIRLYTDRVISLQKTRPEKEHQQFSQECASYFYVWRIGELVGHLPYQQRKNFERASREFRNNVSHTFEKGELNELPSLNINELLETLSQRDNSSSMFHSGDSKNDPDFFANLSYAYRENDTTNDISLLTQLRINEASLAEQVHVCQKIEIEANGNLFHKLRGPITDIKKSNQEDAVLLVPATLKAADENISYALALHFKQGELKEISYSALSTNTKALDNHLEFLQHNWCSQSPNKNIPSLKCVENPLMVHTGEFDRGVAQVECLLRLAERKLKNGTTSPFPRANKGKPSITMLRQKHINLAWLAGRHDFYFNQLMKKVLTPISVQERVTIRDPGHETRVVDTLMMSKDRI
jgi:hypothetical protein